MVERKGYEKLWLWFGLSRASFLTLPRAMMHDMPDDWQNRMADLLDEWDSHWPNFPEVKLDATCRRNGKLVPMPEEFQSYRHTPPGTFDHMRTGQSVDASNPEIGGDR
jgi:hypothetical protein